MRTLIRTGSSGKISHTRGEQALRRCSRFGSLAAPQILHRDNHLLVVNKPAGWHTVPNLDNDEKCLLSYLKNQGFGGGSRNDFLLPVHRLDQPCTGVVAFAKTSKAASRIQSKWNSVRKSYLCVLDTDRRRYERLRKRSKVLARNDEFELDGLMRRRVQRRTPSESSGGWSVEMESTDGLQPWEIRSRLRSSSWRHCSLQWRLLSANEPYFAVEVQTNQGARHMIRALMSQCGACPIAGDLRYQAKEALPDRSIALHAHTLEFPSAHIRLGSDMERSYRAPIPSIWYDTFGLTDEMVSGLASFHRVG